MTRRIGITTTVPHEIIVAAGHVPVDLNNVFIGADDSQKMIDLAESEGFPPGVCAWIKGIYAAVRGGAVDAVVAVMTGDCSNTRALAEVLSHRGVEIIPFSYPDEPATEAVATALKDFAQRLGVDLKAAEQVRRQWQPMRRALAELDRLAWEENKVTSAELHQWLVSAGDWEGDPNAFYERLNAFLEQAQRREPQTFTHRLALLGVPPIYSDLFEVVEQRDARFVFTEVPRQFSMPYDCADLVEQFCRYTYPYDLRHRLNDLAREIQQRNIDGAINYLQAFCHRQIEDIVLRETLPTPMLAVEADQPGPVPGQIVTRLEAFLEMIS